MSGQELLRRQARRVADVRVAGPQLAVLVGFSALSTTGIVAASLEGGRSDVERAALLQQGAVEVHRQPAAPTTAAAAATTDDEPEVAEADADAGETDDGGTSAATRAAADDGGDAAEDTSEAATSDDGTATGDGADSTPAKGDGPPAGTKIEHVFVVSLDSPGYDASFGPAGSPYLTKTLVPKGLLLTQFGLLDDADLPNGLALLAGQPPNPQTQQECPTYSDVPADAKPAASGAVTAAGCVFPVNTLTVADQLSSAGRSWRAYVQGMGDKATCRRPGPGEADPTVSAGPADPYATRRNPPVYFHSLLDLGDCAANDVGLDRLDADLKQKKSTPSLSLITPDLCHDGSRDDCGTTGAAAADAFLAAWVPKILASAAYRKGGLLVITFGGARPPAADAPAGFDRRRTGTLLVSPWTAAGTTDATKADPYALLRTIEDLFGLSHLANAGAAGVPSFASPALGEGAAPPDN